MSELIPFSVGDQSFDVFVARPEGAGPHPVVMVCHAWGGRDDFAEAKARTLTELGYIGAAIDIYGIGKRGTDKESSQALMMPLVSNPPELRARLTAAFEAVRNVEGVDPQRMGAIGFCFGGLCAILCARMGLDLNGVVSFHGLLKVGEPLETSPKARILVLHGQDDPMAPPEDVGTFAAEMKRIDADWELHAYPGVLHAFTNPKANDRDFGTVYDAAADARSWIAMRRFFEDVL